ncbi:hypothetical protein SAMN02910353_02245 [Ruminococcus sp. YRD2003]|nr:hypothetical protein SAMN02910353_02245 [Ruminococcus flavefaciens]
MLDHRLCFRKGISSDLQPNAAIGGILYRQCMNCISDYQMGDGLYAEQKRKIQC